MPTAFKTVDETRTTAAFANDADMVVPLLPGYYAIDAMLRLGTTDQGVIQIQFTYSGTLNDFFAEIMLAFDDGAPNEQHLLPLCCDTMEEMQQVTYGSRGVIQNTATEQDHTVIDGWINVLTAGNLILQWRETTASGRTTLRKNSHLSAIIPPQTSYVHNDAIQTTASALFVDALTIVTPVLNGVFWIDWSCDAGNTGSNGVTNLRIQDVTDSLTLSTAALKAPLANYIQPYSGFFQQTFLGSKTIKLQYSAGNNTATIQNARIRIHPVL
jgi:hypothetical protein